MTFGELLHPERTTMNYFLNPVTFLRKYESTVSGLLQNQATLPFGIIGIYTIPRVGWDWAKMSLDSEKIKWPMIANAPFMKLNARLRSANEALMMPNERLI